jgi:hypothetical protein
MAQGHKTGGRMKGTPNKTTQEIRGLIENFINSNVEGLQECYNALDPKDKLQFLIKLLDFSIPRFKTIEMGIKNEPKTISRNCLACIASEKLRRKLEMEGENKD